MTESYIPMGVDGACSYGEALDYLGDIHELYGEWCLGRRDLSPTEKEAVAKAEGTCIRYAQDGSKEGFGPKGSKDARRAAAAGVRMEFVEARHHFRSI